MPPRRAWVLALLAAACSRAGGDAASQRTSAADPQSCIGCHVEVNPGLVADHESSPHRTVPLGCEDCHGDDHEQMFAVAGAVAPTVCARCHQEAYDAFRRSRHGIRLREGKLDALLLSASSATGGCTATGGCHSIQQVYGDGSVGRCGSCHPTHAFSNREARNPRVCTTCHEGADHPQYRVWLRSAHSLRSPSGSGHVADCVTCHSTHDVSDAVVHGLPPVRGARPPASVPAAPPEEFQAARAIMVERCAKCHTKRLARTALEGADRWRQQGAAMLDEAARRVKGLHRDGLLDPAPATRARNPVAGHGLRLGGAQIFDQSVSLPERLYYEMHFQHYPALNAFGRSFKTD
ncbi:MAG: multiheme c-type cytochrome, partial [Planctomycetota bacterium]